MWTALTKAAVGVACSVGITVTTGCAAPTRGLADYQRMAANTAEAVLSQVQTAAFTGHLVIAKRLPLPYASSTVSNAEDAASAVQETFASRQPPTGHAADALRDEMDAAIQDATSAISDMRIAIRRGDLDDVRGALDELDKARPPLVRLQDLA